MYFLWNADASLQYAEFALTYRGVCTSLLRPHTGDSGSEVVRHVREYARYSHHSDHLAYAGLHEFLH